MSGEWVDYYKVLSVSPKATPEEIKRAWHRKMMLFHPDHHLSEQKKYERISGEINRAYEVLSDPEERALFDKQRKQREREARKCPPARERSSASSKKGASATPSPRKNLLPKDHLSIAEKIIFTVLTAGIVLLFFILPKWSLCPDPTWRYLLTGTAADAVADSVLVSSVLAGVIFVLTVLIGKSFKNRLSFFSFWEVFLLALACAESVVVPLREQGFAIAVVASVIGITGVFFTYGARKNLLAGLLLRSVLAVLCLLAYRAGKLIFSSLDELATAGCLLVFSAFLLACACTAFTTQD